MLQKQLCVIIPVYNAEKYLEECLNSILEQTYTNIEVICINDCSTDNSLDILNEYKTKDNRITIINNKRNLGPGDCRNIGIRSTNCNYIHFIDSDDFLIDKDAYKTLLEKMTRLDLDLLFFDNKEFDNNTNTFINNNLKRFKSQYKEKDFNHLLTKDELEKLCFNINAFAWNKIYKRSFLINNKIYFPEKIFYEDTAFANYISLYAKRVFITKYQIYAYRVNIETSITQNITSKFDSIIKMHYVLYDFLKDRNLYQKYKIKLTIFCISTLCLYFLPQINNFDLASKLNKQILEFIKCLNLSKEEIKEIEKSHWFIANIIKEYLKDINQINEIIYIRFFRMPFIKIINRINKTSILLFNFIPIYHIQIENNKLSKHYLFNILPIFRIKETKIYLFFCIPIFKLNCFKLYTENYSYILKRNQLLKEEK